MRTYSVGDGLQSFEPGAMSSPETLEILVRITGSHRQALAAARRYRTWQELITAGPPELLDRLRGGRKGKLPMTPPAEALPTLTRGIDRVAAECGPCPGRVMALPDPPAVLHVAGVVPSVDMVTVVGTDSPSPEAIELATTTALAAAAAGIPVVARMDNATGRAASTAALNAGGTIVAVVAARAAAFQSFSTLVGRVRETGGGVVTATIGNAGCGTGSLAAAFSSLAVVAECGPYTGAEAATIRALVGLETRLVARRPPDGSSSSATAGLSVLADPGRFTPDWFGVNGRIRHRVARGRPAADAVVTDPRQMAELLHQAG